MRYDDYEEREKLDIHGFIMLMIVCGILCIFGYIIGRAVMALLGMA